MRALVNTYFNWVEACLVSAVRKLNSTTLCIDFVKLDLADFLSFPPLLLMTSLFSTLVVGIALAGLRLVFNNEVNRATILLKS